MTYAIFHSELFKRCVCFSLLFIYEC